VTIVTTEQKGRPYAFTLAPGIELIDLAIGYEDNNGGSLFDKIVHYPGKQRRHRKALKAILTEQKPDITVSMFCNDVNLIPKIKDGSKKILEVHFSRFKRLQYERKGLWGLSDRIRSRQDERLAGKYDRFVVLTEEDKTFWGKTDNIRVIGNPVNFHPATPAPLDTKTVIAVGRYAHQKGLERLLSAWSLITEKNGWILRLVGDGELRPELEAQINALGIGDSVILGKMETDMAAVYSGASILALPSRYEGFGMALLEARCFGVPAVAFDCKCGPKELIRDGVDSILVKEGDVEGLADGLKTLMQDDHLRKKMGKEAFDSAPMWFIDKIMQKWTALFEEIL
jgi:glycosyltransferase involved in cell wall biosynthesis